MQTNSNASTKRGGVSPTLTTMQGGHQEPKILQRMVPNPLIAASRGRNIDNPSDRTPGEAVEQRLEVNTNGTSNTITTVQKDNYVLLQRGRGNNCGGLKATDGVCPTLSASSWEDNNHLLIKSKQPGTLFLYNTWWWVRKLTPRECLRLQDFPDTFKVAVSNSQAYKQVGNSISVNILEMIFRQIEKAKAGEVPVGRLF